MQKYGISICYLEPFPIADLYHPIRANFCYSLCLNQPLFHNKS